MRLNVARRDVLERAAAAPVRSAPSCATSTRASPVRATGPRAVPRDRDVPRGVPPPHAGRPDADGAAPSRVGSPTSTTASPSSRAPARPAQPARPRREVRAAARRLATSTPPEIVARRASHARRCNRVARRTLRRRRAHASKAAGLLNEKAVGAFVTKIRSKAAEGVSETDEIALVRATTTMLLHDGLVASPALAPAALPTKVVAATKLAA